MTEPANWTRCLAGVSLMNEPSKRTTTIGVVRTYCDCIATSPTGRSRPSIAAYDRIADASSGIVDASTEIWRNAHRMLIGGAAGAVASPRQRQWLRLSGAGRRIVSNIESVAGAITVKRWMYRTLAPRPPLSSETDRTADQTGFSNSSTLADSCESIRN